MAYCCPQCKWRWNRKYFYKVKNGNIKILDYIKDVAAEYKYPIIKDEYENYFTKVLSWREIIYCPKCRLEVEYDMNETKAKEILDEQAFKVV